jgi:hypothetical protein
VAVAIVVALVVLRSAAPAAVADRAHAGDDVQPIAPAPAFAEAAA